MPESEDEAKVLDSWKEIAVYLHRSVMTCHRWEQELGLPVHRLDETPKARVFAYADEIDRWKTEKLNSAGGRRNSSWKVIGKGLVAIGAIAVIVATIVLGRPFLVPAAVPIPVRVPSLAVFPFDDQTGDEALDAWSTAFADLFVTDLGQSRFLNVITSTRLYHALKELAEATRLSPEDLKRAAETAQLDYTVTGSLKKTAEGIIIAAVIQNPRRGEVIASLRFVCSEEKQFFGAADDLSRQAKIALNLTRRQLRQDIDENVARITTSSPEAFKLYSKGYRQQGKGRMIEAVAPLRRAVEVDPDFGFAYRLLFNTANNLSRQDDAENYLSRTLDLAGRLPEKERGIFLGEYYLNEGKNKEKALRAMQRVHGLYPYDPANGGLASVYMFQEEWERAIPVWETLLQRDSKNWGAIQELSRCYEATGRYGQAEQILDEALRAMPKVPPALLLRPYNLAMAQGKFETAHEYADRMLAFDPGHPGYRVRKGAVYLKQDDWTGAEREFQNLVVSEAKGARADGYHHLALVSLSRGQVEQARRQALSGIEAARSDKDTFRERHLHYLLAYVQRLSGRLPEALKEAEEACQNSEEEGVGAVRELHLLAVIMLEMNKLEDFDKQIATIKAFLDPDRFPRGSPRLMRVYYHLLGLRELRKENYRRAVDHFGKTVDLLSPHYAADIDADHAKYYDSLAEAYRLAGDDWNALKTYEKIRLPAVSREFSGDAYAKSFHWTGRICEESLRRLLLSGEVAKEHSAKAIADYRKFLSLWGDADPVFPEVADARKRLARLISE